MAKVLQPYEEKTRAERVIIPTEFFGMARSMAGLSEKELATILFLLDGYMKRAPLPTLEGFYKTIAKTTKEIGPL